MTKPKEKWEKEFDKKFYWHPEIDLIKSFIHSLLSQERTRVLEELMEDIAELRFEEWKEPIDRVYEILKETLKKEGR